MLPLPAIPVLIKNWRVIALVLVLTVVSGTIFAGYRHYSSVVADNARLSADVATLASAVAQEKATNKAALDALRRWKDAEKHSARIKKKAEAVADAARAEGKRLDEAFNESLSAEALAARDDVNRILRMLERETSERRSRRR